MAKKLKEMDGHADRLPKWFLVLHFAAKNGLQWTNMRNTEKAKSVKVRVVAEKSANKL